MDSATLERLLLREIRRAPGISRRDLADRLSVARSTAGRRVDHLIDRGLLQESGIEQRSEAGRPKRQLELRGDYGNFIGFDFDARHIYVSLINFAQDTVDEKIIPLSGRPTRDEVIDHLRDAIDTYGEQKTGAPLLGTGIGVPGQVQRQERLGLSYSYIEGWKNVDLCKALEIAPEFLRIENNTRAIALGEYWLGSASMIEHLVCITVRTGISAAIISGGRLLRGSHEMAGEIRGWTVKKDELDSPSPSWLEDCATVRAISPNGVTTPDIWSEFVTACQDGNREALAQLNGIARHHGDTVARLIQIADPEAVFFSGAFNELGETYLNRVREATAIALLGQYFSPPPIRFVSLGQFTGSHGAAALAAEHFHPA